VKIHASILPVFLIATTVLGALLITSPLVVYGDLSHVPSVQPDEVDSRNTNVESFNAFGGAIINNAPYAQDVTGIEGLDIAVVFDMSGSMQFDTSGYGFYEPYGVGDTRWYNLTYAQSDYTSLEEVFMSGYGVSRKTINGLHATMQKLYELYPHKSKGYEFLIGKITTKTKGSGALKRWNMFLRWMVRDDNIDMGLWKKVDKADLIMPLDTHTFNVGQRLGLLKRKTYDLEAAIELTQALKKFDKNDPLKYDFALYRLGQEKLQ